MTSVSLLFYSYCVHGPQHKDAMEDLVRREVERCDRFAGIFAMMSVAGGTGSGVGTYVTQCLRDSYPHSFILNHLIWPYGTGEVNLVIMYVSFKVMYDELQQNFVLINLS